MIHTTTLGQLADVRSGFVFRSTVAHDPDGSIQVVGMKDLRMDAGIAWDSVIRIQSKPKYSDYFLQEGDILFTVRGARFYGVFIDAIEGEAIASHHLFHIRVRDKQAVMPAFLSWLMNRAEAQRYYAEHAMGQSTSSGLRGLRRPDMENLPIHLPSMEKQKAVMQMVDCLRQEITVLEASIKNRLAIQDALVTELRQGYTEAR